ncbi:hypothetical protein RhiirA1_486168 [Rhizophagus irregularis]|uniref:Uncharacterized protein n=1 Tax=Rhizophagus irregularis TaxID=588596 RepID=A0A2N0QHI9_9GLOM|nr:hypothetical protein RhiirA1_486168 [Rhizophagus irregularis]
MKFKRQSLGENIKAIHSAIEKIKIKAIHLAPIHSATLAVLVGSFLYLVIGIFQELFMKNSDIVVGF